MSEKLRLVSSHINVDGTFTFTALAGKTKIKRLLDVLIFPTIRYHLTLHHFKKKVSTATCTVLFIERCHVAGTHGAAISLSAFTDTYTTQRCSCKASLIIRILEKCLHISVTVIYTETKIGI